ncbi:hypothetical protein AMECASPLE_007056 [Ameca splendens]|uniref:Uncharacterized protein n=1 Tax=Ameca splendens TaxID=208324 RepID=A0ABV0XNL0_9TELE
MPPLIKTSVSRVEVKESPFKSGCTDLRVFPQSDGSHMWKVDMGSDRQSSLMLHFLLQSPIKGLHTRAPLNTEAPSHAYIHPSNDTCRLSMMASLPQLMGA